MIRYLLSVIIIIVAFLCAGSAKAANNPDTLYKRGKFAEAEKAYNEADMNNPKDIRFRYNRGCAAYKNSDYKSAEAAFSSVLKRTEDKEIKFKTLYNLGNTAFKQKDYESAASYYKQAIISNPGNENAAYNLELSLIYLENQKKNQKDQKNGSQTDSQKKEPDQSGKNKNDDKKNQKADDKQSLDNKENKKDEPEKGKESGNNKGDKENSENNDKKEGSKNLSEGRSKEPGSSQQEVNTAPGKAGAMLDKKKANDLLDNIKENRSIKAFGNIKANTRSGKDW